MSWSDVCELSQILPFAGVCALIDGRQVALFRTNDDAVHAIDNRDPASNANVLSRGIVGDLKGEIVVASPLYKHHYSLATGRCLEDPRSEERRVGKEGKYRCVEQRDRE